jgi:selenocysteine lyase/cysteine desulfurase
MTSKTRLVAFTLASHILRVQIPYAELNKKAISGCICLVDAHRIAHQQIDVKTITT